VRVIARKFIQIIPNLSGDKSINLSSFYGFSLDFFQQ